TTSTFAPVSASAEARFTVVVVFPTPPFWLATTNTRVVVGSGTTSLARAVRRCVRSASWLAIGVVASKFVVMSGAIVSRGTDTRHPARSPVAGRAFVAHHPTVLGSGLRSSHGVG